MHPVIELLLICAAFALLLASVIGTLLFCLIKIYLWFMQKRLVEARQVITEYEERSGHRADQLLFRTKGLFLCKLCNQAEIELAERCPAAKVSCM